MARAQGARAQMGLVFETVYGAPPAAGWRRVPFASASHGAEQPLLSSELLGYGRDPLPPIKDAVTADGDVAVPLDAEAFGVWLKAAFGQPTTTGAGPLGIAIRSLFDNIGRLITYAATFAAFLAGRWVAGMAVAALSVRGLATALVVLRGALIRAGIVALIVGAGVRGPLPA